MIAEPFLLRFAEALTVKPSPAMRRNILTQTTECLEGSEWVPALSSTTMRGGQQTKTAVNQESTDFR